ncbi:hypothetical protein MA16_Dca022020 [Dendrobium catenatum]|uniref:Uncharacterized protein n=1 Tax=Dendrobium catenatum TaxID=906689 RepID=A0A2I0X6B9_9ASPA|nr:hypothetical protein MA16_Dca022020 [Dendrobium catenatum]
MGRRRVQVCGSVSPSLSLSLSQFELKVGGLRRSSGGEATGSGVGGRSSSVSSEATMEEVGASLAREEKGL